MKLRSAARWLALGLCACSARRLPPGTPPPEYEPPQVAPWPIENADAGAGAVLRDAGVPDASSSPELSSDAGVR